MKRLAYANLFIDNDWDTEKILDRIFKVRIQSTQSILESYNTFGHFFSGEHDYVLMESRNDPDLLAFWNQFFSVAEEVSLNDLGKIKVDSLSFVGISTKEEALAAHFNLTLTSSSHKYIELNSKDLLWKMAIRNNINFPPTELIGINELKNVSPGTVLKFLTSSGGRGVLIIDEKKKDLPGYFAEQLTEIKPNLKLLKQKFVSIKNNFYTLADTETNLVHGFRIDYDLSNSSRRHVPELNINAERTRAAHQLAQELKSLGYHGSFGFDGFEDVNGDIYPAIDLNVRIDKARFIHEAAKKFGISHLNFEFRRERVFGVPFSNFKELKKTLLDVLEVSGYKCIPVICSNMFSMDSKPRQMEFSFFVVITNKNADSSALHSWSEKMVKLLEKR